MIYSVALHWYRIKMFIKQHRLCLIKILHNFFMMPSPSLFPCSYTFCMLNLDITNSIGWLTLRQSTETMSLSALTISIFRLFRKLCSILTLSSRNMVQTVVPLDIMVQLYRFFLFFSPFGSSYAFKYYISLLHYHCSINMKVFILSYLRWRVGWIWWNNKMAMLPPSFV